MIAAIHEPMRLLEAVASMPDTSGIAHSIPSDSWVFIAIFALVALWLIGISILFYKLLRQYTFGKDWTKEKPNPFQHETFSMPRGVLRGTLTLSLLFIVMLMEVVNLTIGGLEDRMDELLVAFQMMLAFYFGSKVMHHLAATDKKKAEFAAHEAPPKPPAP
ncbi:MAG: hypothetical protein ACE5HO_19020 [bacterium]